MMATAFLGYSISPKWLNIIFMIIFIIIYIFVFIIHEEIINDIKNENNKNKIKNYLKSNKINLIGYKIIRNYSTNNSVNSNIKISGRLNEIIKELNSDSTKKQILKDTEGLSGIYMIVNKITKDYYIGSASTNRFYARFSNHTIYFRGSKIVKLAIKKYKIENFAFLILELYPNIVTKENNHELINLEDKYLKSLLPNYNILTEAGSSFGYKHTEFDRQKMKDNYSDERREKIGNLNKGKTLSPETIEKLRQKDLLRPAMSDEIKKKCITNTRPVILYNLNGTIYGEYSTIKDAANAINCNEKTIRRALQTEKKLVKRK